MRKPQKLAQGSSEYADLKHTWQFELWLKLLKNRHNQSSHYTSRAALGGNMLSLVLVVVILAPWMAASQNVTNTLCDSCAVYVHMLKSLLYSLPISSRSSLRV